MRIDPAFGEAVARVLAKHGLSLRGQRLRTGIDHMTMKEMKAGVVPRLEKVEDFARGFDEDVNEWRVRAGYEPVEDHRPALERIHDARQELTYHPDFEDVRLEARRGSQPIPPEDLADLEKLLRAELTEQRRRQGRE